MELQQKMLQNIYHGLDDMNVMAEASVFFIAFRPILESIRALTENPAPKLSFKV